MELAIDKKLEHRASKAYRKIFTVFHRLGKQKTNELKSRLGAIIWIVGEVEGTARARRERGGAEHHYRPALFNASHLAACKRAEINLRVIFSQIYPSKQKEARGAYEETMTLLKDIREACKAQIQKDKDNAKVKA